MSRYTVWTEKNKKYSVHDLTTDETATGEDGKPLTDLTYSQAAERAWKLNNEPKKP
jgi:hypothetical protein